MHHYANKKHQEAPVYQVGNKVFVKSHLVSSSQGGVAAKLGPRRDGPYLIIQVISPTSYEIASLDNPTVPLGKHHVNDLYLFRVSSDTTPLVPLRKRGRPHKQPVT